MDPDARLLVTMGGFMFREKHSNKTYVLPAGQVGACLRINGEIRVTEEEIQDRSKGDMVTKGLVVIQAT